jgi:hypothetical protein
MTEQPAATEETAEPLEVARAAAWAVNVADNSARQGLLYGHRARRIPIERAGLPATDYRLADLWLVEQYRTAHSVPAEALPTSEEI